MTLTPEQRIQRARIGGLSRWAKEDPAPAMAHVREGFDKRFLDAVDPDRVLPEGERRRRAEAAKRAYFSKLALKSAEARRKKGTLETSSPKKAPGRPPHCAVLDCDQPGTHEMWTRIATGRIERGEPVEHRVNLKFCEQHLQELMEPLRMGLKVSIA